MIIAASKATRNEKGLIELTTIILTFITFTEQQARP